jgi:hypothetical protein
MRRAAPAWPRAGRRRLSPLISVPQAAKRPPTGPSRPQKTRRPGSARAKSVSKSGPSSAHLKPTKRTAPRRWPMPPQHSAAIRDRQPPTQRPPKTATKRLPFVYSSGPLSSIPSRPRVPPPLGVFLSRAHIRQNHQATVPGQRLQRLPRQSRQDGQARSPCHIQGPRLIQAPQARQVGCMCNLTPRHCSTAFTENDDGGTNAADTCNPHEQKQPLPLGLVPEDQKILKDFRKAAYSYDMRWSIPCTGGRRFGTSAIWGLLPV